MKRQPKAGDRVVLLSEEWNGTEGTIRKVYARGEVSVAVKQKDIPAAMKPIILSPRTGHAHWIALPGEYEIITEGIFT